MTIPKAIHTGAILLLWIKEKLNAYTCKDVTLGKSILLWGEKGEMYVKYPFTGVIYNSNCTASIQNEIEIFSDFYSSLYFSLKKDTKQNKKFCINDAKYTFIESIFQLNGIKYNNNESFDKNIQYLEKIGEKYPKSVLSLRALHKIIQNIS